MILKEYLEIFDITRPSQIKPKINSSECFYRRSNYYPNFLFGRVNFWFNLTETHNIKNSKKKNFKEEKKSKKTKILFYFRQLMTKRLDQDNTDHHKVGEPNPKFTCKHTIQTIDIEYFPIEIFHHVIPLTGLVEKHVLRFVCKKLHSIVHNVSVSNNSKFNSFKLCSIVVLYNNLHLLKWAREISFDWDENTCLNIGHIGNLEILKWALENGCPWNWSILHNVIKKGRLDILKWAFENGFSFDNFTISKEALNDLNREICFGKREFTLSSYVCSEAAKFGRFAVLKWAFENGCPWNENTCSKAAKGGYLEILKWVRENGCPWDKNTCYEAERCGHLEILKWAFENGCPLAFENGCSFNKWICLKKPQTGI
jgi:hypothetical protein